MLFLDDFLEMLEELPAELRERFTEMRRIDGEVEAGLEQTKKDIDEFFGTGGHLSDDEKQARFLCFQQELSKLRSMAEEKVAMAERIQNIIEKYLQHLDKEKTHFKYELEADNPGITEIIEKRFSDYVESVIAARKERKRRFPSENGSHYGEPSLKIPKVCSEFNLSTHAELSITDEDLLSPLMPLLSASMNGSGRGRKSHHLDSPVPTKKRPSIPSLKSTLSVPSHLNGMAMSPALSEKSWTSSAVETHSPNSSMLMNPLAQLVSPSMPNFVGAESRHGRPRKLTSRVQEMFSEAVQRQRRQHNVHPTETEEETERSDGEDSDDAQKSWCFCGEASYGEMVCCDNERCSIQWFHYECIGITATPKGKWFCPQCRNETTSPSHGLEPPPSF